MTAGTTHSESTGSRSNQNRASIPEMPNIPPVTDRNWMSMSPTTSTSPSDIIASPMTPSRPAGNPVAAPAASPPRTASSSANQNGQPYVPTRMAVTYDPIANAAP